MAATFIALAANMLNSEQNVQECDATGLYSSNVVWAIINNAFYN